MTYRTDQLSQWSTLLAVGHTVWTRRSLWHMAIKLWLLSLVVGILVLMAVKDPAALKVDKFKRISGFLQQFVGLLLGFFMAASVKRWWSCVQGVLGLCGSIRKLKMQLIATGLPNNLIRGLLRYAALSAWALHLELHISAMATEEEKEEAKMESWDQMRLFTDRSDEEFTGQFTAVTAEELEKLQELTDPAGALWIWIGSLLGRYMEDGEIKTGAAPAFCRCMSLSGEALDRILCIRASITVQAPYIYVQMLASLVHINNVVNALSFGMTSGVAAGTWMASLKRDAFGNMKPGANATATESSQDMQSVVVAFFFSCFGPFVYQALLEVSIAIAQPFGNTDAIVPTKRILATLDRDLQDGLNSGTAMRHQGTHTFAKEEAFEHEQPSPPQRAYSSIV